MTALFTKSKVKKCITGAVYTKTDYLVAYKLL